MARFNKGWVQFPREALAIGQGDPILLALFATLCAWAKVKEDKSDSKIKIGEVLTSDRELSFQLAYERRSICRKLKVLSDKGLIELKRDGKRGRIISVCHLIVSKSCAQSVSKSTSSESKEKPESCPSECPSHVPYIKEKRKDKEERENSRAHVLKEEEKNKKGSLSLLLTKSNQGEGKLIPLPPPEGRMALPEAEEALAMGWYGRACEMASGRGFTFEQICDQISQLRQKGYDTQKQLQILEFIKIDSIGVKFLAPIDGLNQHFGQLVIEVAYAKYKNSPQGKLEVLPEKTLDAKAQREARMRKVVEDAQKRAQTLKKGDV